MKTQKCPRCNHEIPDHVNVCTQCGKVFGINRSRREGTVRGRGCLILFGLTAAGLGGILFCLDRVI